jgi:tripartite-type tricarboxylate transporter receptor subunit TctC
MLETRIINALIGAMFAGVAAIATDAAAQEYPNRPITLVVAYAAGGPVDTVARIFGSRLSEVLGQQVIIENIGGAGGMTGAGRVAKATPDGYYMLFGGSSNLAQNQTLYRKPLYNSAVDFEPVGLLTDSPRALITRKDFPATTLPEFAAYAKANQGKMQYYSAGGGSGSHICALLARPGHGHANHACTVSRRRASHAGLDCGPHRLCL